MGPEGASIRRSNLSFYLSPRPMKHDIYLRCHTRILGDTSERKRQFNRSARELQYVLLLDTETTTDSKQNLNFGAYQFCERDPSGNFLCLEEGLFYADDLDITQTEVLRKYVRNKNRKRTGISCPKLKLYRRDAFVEEVFHVAVQAGAAVCAYHLPFDLSRIAVEYRVAHGAGKRGWSFVIFRYWDKKNGKWLPNSFRPRIQLRPKDSKAAFIRLAGGDKDQPFRRGHFLDVKTLAWSLRNKSFSLESACREFKVSGKLDHAPTGRVTRDEIDYCRQDVNASVGLLNALLSEFRRYPLGGLPAEKAFSAASIAKAFLNTMGVTQPEHKFQLDDKTNGICMQGYYGGRAEIRIRHTSVPVIYTDFLSQYPTVNTLLGLWRLLIARKIRVREATRDVETFLKSVDVNQMLDLKTWHKLNFFVLVQPDADILPVRAVYGENRVGGETNIGLNPLTSDKPIWFAGPDVVASRLFTGKTPKILRAIRFEAKGIQKGLHTVKLGKESINPTRDDCSCKVIELRKGKKKSDPLYYFLKIFANAGCYGIYAEVNRHQVGKNDAKQVGIFSGEANISERATIMERPGPYYFPPVSALITAGGRLLLCMLEKMVADAGGTYLMCDTDSMAIVASEHGGLVPCNGGLHKMPDGRDAIKALSWVDAREIVDRFKSLNPYNKRVVPGSILNIVEEINFDSEGKQRQVYGYGISAKRYSVYTFDGSEVRIVKASEHGLGLYYRPKEGRDPECDVPLWIKEGWQRILDRVHGLPYHRPDWFDFPVMRRIAITTPHVMTALRGIDRDKARPYNFALSPVIIDLSGSPVTLLGPFEKDPARWMEMPYINNHDGTPHTLEPPTLMAMPQTFGTIFSQYVQHPEYKSLAPDGKPCEGDSHGLLQRYPVTASEFILIGKETERGWEHAEDISTLLPSLKRYERNTGTANESLRERLQQMSLNALQKETGLSRNTILRARRGLRVHPRSLQLLWVIHHGAEQRLRVTA
jgi:hypothetical protein